LAQTPTWLRRWLGSVAGEGARRWNEDRPLTILSIVGSAVALGRAIQASSGAYSPEAFHWITIAFALALAPIVLPELRLLDNFVLRYLLVGAFGIAAAYQFGWLATTMPIFYLDLATGRTLAEFAFLLAIAATAAGAVSARTGIRTPWLPPLVLLLYVLLGLWTLKASPRPTIDVFSIHQESLAALLRGVNPYTITFPNPYGMTNWYSPGVATYDRLLFGYVYPAWTLVVALPGYLLANDYRYSFLAASTLSAALAIYARPAWSWALAAALLFLFTPRGFFVLEQGWTEPVLLFGIAVSLFAASRRVLWLLPIGLGIVACAKQYSILAAPAALLLKPLYEKWGAFMLMILKAIATAAVITLPFVLWGPKEYWHDVYGIQFSAPYRPDALSLPVHWAMQFGSKMPRVLQLGAPALLTILTLLRAPRTPAGFAWAGGTIYFIFFMFRQGFCNYYYLVIGIYALAAAVAQPSAPVLDADRRFDS
jgi:hypothetical protein